MKRIMSIGDLKRYYDGHNPKRILFCTENQSWGKVENPMRVSLSFTSMVMACNPNVICLKDGENTLWFERVKRVIVDAERSPLGTILDVVCGDSSNKENDIHYTIITLS